MSDWHRDNPEFCDDIDAMLGVPVRRCPSRWTTTRISSSSREDIETCQPGRAHTGGSGV
jgi:hypothetical protein